ncbi:hypothetical protein RSO41_12335 [Halomonas sp. I1]|uniref:hypothetical protein n=1 Tax=Halomonas sp. I1 TaxID=393536 RepID=UPI0028DE8476|nr:hypothetical protein [Halomonas sp. I1]MDT8895444.1 hypothetical protein [Halomonas sp. I1]
MRLIDDLMGSHPLLEERPVKRILEPFGFQIHIETQDVPCEMDDPQGHDKFCADPQGFMDALSFSIPEGFTELDRFETEDGEIVMLAVQPITPLAHLLMLPVDSFPSIGAIAAERRRQVDAEGWSAEHDDRYRDGQLADAAASYAGTAALTIRARESDSSRLLTSQWPWPEQWWKPTTPRRDLEKAGGLIAAELARMDRAEGMPS